MKEGSRGGDSQQSALSISGSQIVGGLEGQGQQEIWKEWNSQVGWCRRNKGGWTAGRASLAATRRAHSPKLSLSPGQWSSKDGPWFLDQQHQSLLEMQIFRSHLRV